MVQDPLQLSTLEWTVRPSTSEPGWRQVPEPVRARVASGFPATVPGCVHTDLMAADLLSDPYHGVAEHDQDWVGEQTWIYTCVFGRAIRDFRAEATAPVGRAAQPPVVDDGAA